MIDLSTSIAGVKLKNPTILASGILGVTASSLLRVEAAGAGAVTCKSIGLDKRTGHHTPVMVEVSGGLLNAVGLSCPSLDESVEELLRAKKKLSIPLVVSFYGKTAKEFGDVAEILSEVEPALLEANISCPNIECDFGKPFGTTPETAAKVTKEIKRRTDVPLIVKLTPNVSDIVSIAKAVEDAGADAINAINTLGPGMAINIEMKKPVLSNKFGGMSGAAIRPIAVRCVYQIKEAVKIPIIGTGGVSTGRDAVEMMMAGSCAVGVGTAVMGRDMDAFMLINKEIREFMKKNGYSRIKQLIGAAH
jgi:dihydroorotate dehydrogenase (NAD+) catalytic subunit